MNCTEFKNQLDNYLDHQLCGSQLADFHKHNKDCDKCHDRLQAELHLLERLRRLPVPPSSTGFFYRAMATAKQKNHRYRQRKALGVGSAIAASLALVFVMQSYFLPVADNRQNYIAGSTPAEIPGLQISLNQVKNVNVVFNSVSPLQKITISLRLPDGIELEGYPNQRQLIWQSDLMKGKNLLTLPIIARSHAGGIISASVKHENDEQTYQFRMNVNPERETRMLAPVLQMT